MLKPAIDAYSRKTALEDPNYKYDRFNVFVRIRPPRTQGASLTYSDITVILPPSTLTFSKVFSPNDGLPAKLRSPLCFASLYSPLVQFLR